MAEIIKMPLLSDTMKEGVIAKWHKKVGDSVKNGDLLAEIETDKATMDLESFFDGVLLYAGGEDGATITVGNLLAIIGKEGEDIKSLIEGNNSAANGKDEVKREETPVVQNTQEEKSTEKSENSENNNEKENTKTEENKENTEEKKENGEEERLKASPLAKAMAKEKGIDISKIQGSGEGGRIIKKDVENFVPQKEETAQKNEKETAQQIQLVANTNEDYTDTPASQMRKTIARRLAESKFSAPHFYLTMEINMDRTIEVRKMLNELSETKISFNDIIIKAVALSLRKHPKVNSSWLGDKIRTYHHIHIGMAVAVEEGLIVPVIRNADQKGMAEIAQLSKSFAEKARNKELQPADWEGNTFTVSNLGMFGIEEFTAIINPPDACIMAIGAISQQAIVKNGEIVVGNVMKVTLSCDHRAVDGAVGSAFLQTVKILLEEPMKMLI